MWKALNKDKVERPKFVDEGKPLQEKKVSTRTCNFSFRIKEQTILSLDSDFNKYTNQTPESIAPNRKNVSTE